MMQIPLHNRWKCGVRWAAFSIMLFSLGCTPKPSETADAENPVEPPAQTSPQPEVSPPTEPSQPSGGFATPAPTTPQPVKPPVRPNPIPDNQPTQPEPTPPTNPPTTPPVPTPEPSPDVAKPDPKPAVQASGKTGFAIGDLAPDIHGEDLDEVAFSLSDYRGKVVVLDFWGDW